MDSGKDFEARVKASLDALTEAHRGAYAVRIEDGGRYAMNRQLADFFYFPSTGGAIAIECKAVKGKSLPLSRLGYGKENGQLSRLLRFIGNGRKSLVAVCYYEDRVCKGRAYLVPAGFLLNLGRLSLTEGDAQRLGVECPKDGRIYRMPLERWFGCSSK